MLGLVQHVKAYERLAIEAAMSGNDEAVLRALLANPLVPGAEAAAGLRDALIEANLRYLPRFAPRG
jgi:6-phospho-beta-glucosidase